MPTSAPAAPATATKSHRRDHHRVRRTRRADHGRPPAARRRRLHRPRPRHARRVPQARQVRPHRPRRPRVEQGPLMLIDWIGGWASHGLAFYLGGIVGLIAGAVVAWYGEVSRGTGGLRGR